MSGREWKPGDVAMVTRENGDKTIALWGGWNWHCAGGNIYSPLDRSIEPRPLVVIDPEDRVQVGQLTKAIVEAAYQHGNLPVSDNGIAEDTTALALRSLLEPPKPLEPTGLGAVVEDADGADWHRTAEGRWIAGDGLRCRAGGWGHIAAVKVLSDGVQP